MNLLRLLTFVSFSCLCSYQVSGQNTRGQNYYQFNDYTHGIYNNEYAKYYPNRGHAMRPYYYDEYGDSKYVPRYGYRDFDEDEEDENETEEMDDTSWDDVDVNSSKTKNTVRGPKNVSEQSKKVLRQPKRVSELAKKATKKSAPESRENLGTTKSKDTARDSDVVLDDSEEGTNKTKRQGTFDDANEITPSDSFYEFDFDNFDPYSELNTTTISKFRDFILMHLARRNNNNKEEEVKDMPEDEPYENTPNRPNNQTNIIRDMFHRYFVRPNYQGQEYNEDCTGHNNSSLSNIFTNRQRNQFTPRDSLNIETGPSSAKFTLTGRRRKLENPKVYVIDNQNHVKDFDDLNISDRHAVLEDSLKEHNVFLCYPAKIKLKENDNDTVEVVLMRTIVKGALERCTDRFFDTTCGKIFAKRFYNTIFL